MLLGTSHAFSRKYLRKPGTFASSRLSCPQLQNELGKFRQVSSRMAQKPGFAKVRRKGRSALRGQMGTYHPNSKISQRDTGSLLMGIRLWAPKSGGSSESLGEKERAGAYGW